MDDLDTNSIQGDSLDDLGTEIDDTEIKEKQNMNARINVRILSQ